MRQPNLCFTKTADQNRLYIPRSRRQREEEQISERVSRDEFQRSIQVRHKRKETPEASSSLGALQVGGQQGIHPLPEISSPWSTTLRLASWGKVLVCSWGCKEILSCNCWILYEIDLSLFLLMKLWCLIVRNLALGLLCSCMVYLDYINYHVLVDLLPIILV